MKKQNLIIAEIGVLKNESIKLLREYFKNAKIFGLDNEIALIQKAKSDGLLNVFYEIIDIKSSDNIKDVFNGINEKFDIIFDDSTHIFDDQIRIIEM